jgi:hypothetical protein
MENEEVTFVPGAWNFDFGNGLTGSLINELLPVMTQDESAKKDFYDGYHTASAEEFFLIAGKLYELRGAKEKVGQNVESARQFIRAGIRAHWLNTQTRISFKSTMDTITQNYGTERALLKDVDFLGKDGLVEEVLSLEQSLALTGKSPQMVANIMSYINETRGHAWRAYHAQRPVSVDEKVVGLGANSCGFNLGCFWDPQDARASFGVRFVQKF